MTIDPSSACETPRCPNCGSPLPAEAPHALCPRCLFAQLDGATEAATDDLPKACLPTPEELASHFPQLEIIESLGRGGMGVVYKARQKSLDRLVALKLLAPERVDDPAFARRFEQEAQALARLSHPNIVTIHDFGQAGGFFYLLMEFVDGVNLRQAMQVGRFTPEQALGIVPPVCEALQYAHERGIVHRDIKPENLLLDKEGRVKIADFGVAKMLGSANGGTSEVPSSTGASTLVAGTPNYMAPEQAATGKVDQRADIYSLGVVLYELLTGELPGAMLQPPSRKVRLDVRIDEIVLRALEKTPELRFTTAAEFRTQVEAAVADHRDPTTPPTMPATPRTPPPFLRSFWIVLLIALPAVMLLGLMLAAIAGGRLSAREMLAITATTVIPGFAILALVLIFIFIWRRDFALGASPDTSNPASASPARPPHFSRTAIAGFVAWLFSFVALAFGAALILSVTRREMIMTGAGGMPMPVAPWWVHASTVLSVVPGIVAALLATVIGWIAVGQIRRSEGRLRGMPLALFDALALPFLVMLAIVSGVWFWLLRDVVARAIDVRQGELPWGEHVITINPVSIALFASFVTGLLVTFFGFRSIWRAVNSSPASATEAPSRTRRLPRWALVVVVALPILLFAVINWRSRPAPIGVWTADRISNAAPATGDVVVQVEKVERRGQIVWVLLRTSSAHKVRIRPQFTALLSELPPAVQIEAHQGPMVGQDVVLKLEPGPPPYELRMASREVPDILGPGPVWLGFTLPNSEAATVAAEQITQLHLNRPQGLMTESSVLLMFHLTSRTARPAQDERLMGDIFFDLGPQTSGQNSSASRPEVRPGRVIELVGPDPTVNGSCLVDFETGCFLIPPPGLAEKLAKGVADIGDEAAQWLRVSGADAAVQMPAHGALRLFEGFALSRSENPARPLRWDQFTDADVLTTLDTATFEQQQRFENSGRTFYATPATSPTALAFMTREGSMGLLEILGDHTRPPGIKIRYKLVKIAPANPGRHGEKAQ